MTTAADHAAGWFDRLDRLRRHRRARRAQAIGIREHWAYWRARGWFPWNH